MRNSRYGRSNGRSQDRAAIFVDYENLFGLLNDRLDRRGFSDELITEMIDELRRYLYEETHTRTSITFAYADFSALSANGHFIQRALYLQGVEPRFVPSTLQVNAVEIQLCVDAMDVLHHRSDIQQLVLLTGDRAYLPLIQQFQRYGRNALVVALDLPDVAEGIERSDGDLFVDAVNLLSESSRRELSPARAEAPRTNGRSAYRKPEYAAVESQVGIQTLEIIEEYFGQYDEVYLTPLLRKLSELLDERRHDPKSIVSELEDACAVRLEKRRGFPYDYTVLIVDAEHPDVQRVRTAMADDRPFSTDGQAYAEDHSDGEAGDDDYFEDDYDAYDPEDDYHADADDEEAYIEIDEEDQPRH